jgi:hypothetical protein
VRYTVVASMRNEGPFIVEWVCWYRLIGFTDILVVTNDCTDPSPGLLDALQAAGWLAHLRCDVPPGERITGAKLAAARAHPMVTGADWVMVCDVDEFLVIHRGAGRITDLIPPGPPPFLGMSVNWKVFGTSGITGYVDEPVHQQFLRSSRSGHPLSRWVKSIFRRPDIFRRLGEHGPKGAIVASGVDWKSPQMAWVNGDGVPVPGWRPRGEYLRALPGALTSHATAQINHYMLRSAETFGLKRGTLSPVALRDRYDDGYFARTDRNEELDSAALRHVDEFEEMRGLAMALPGVGRLHHLCCADHVARICARAGTDPASDARHAHHLAEAARFGGG